MLLVVMGLLLIVLSLVTFNVAELSEVTDCMAVEVADCIAVTLKGDVAFIFGVALIYVLELCKCFEAYKFWFVNKVEVRVPAIFVLLEPIILVVVVAAIFVVVKSEGGGNGMGSNGPSSSAILWSVSGSKKNLDK